MKPGSPATTRRSLRRLREICSALRVRRLVIAAAMARYVRRAVRRLRDQPMRDLLAGEASFELPGSGKPIFAPDARHTMSTVGTEFSRLVPLGAAGRATIPAANRGDRQSGKGWRDGST